MDSRSIFLFIVLAVAVELIYLVALSRRHVRSLLLRGGRIVSSSGVGTLNILLRSGWLVSMAAEVWLLQRPFLWPLALASAVLSLGALGLRLASIRSLGDRWTLPTVVVPGVDRVRTGIYKWMRHPNWLGVCIEIACTPLIHTAWLSAAAFTVLEALLLRSRMATESRALATAERATNSSSADSADRKVCVIGAGPAGLAMGRELRRRGIPFDILEKNSRPGGIWAGCAGSPIYKNVHLVSPKTSQAFSDLAMPDDYPDFPHHSLVQSYLENYAAQKGLREHVVLGAAVTGMTEVDGGWNVRVEDGRSFRYADVVVATGYHNRPKLPKHPGHFSGTSMHSSAYKGPAQLKGKRVLVVGAGQSAMDIVVDAAIAADAVFHSTRRGFVCAPRYLFGSPLEKLQDNPPPIIGKLIDKLPLPGTFRLVAFLSDAVMRMNGYSNSKLGLPLRRRGDPPVLPTLDQRIYGYYAQGDVKHKPDVDHLMGNQVLFADGSSEVVDVIVYATGYEIDYPFMAPEHLNASPGPEPVPRLFHHIFTRKDNTFVAGLVHPVGAHWRVFEAQARLIATFIMARDAGCADRFIQSKTRYLDRQPQRPASASSALLVSKNGYIAELCGQTVELAKGIPLDTRTGFPRRGTTPDRAGPHGNDVPIMEYSA
jgi:cation diffusion facilitator CzcD-associated flavoprotein CzcO/isoprenylcysteine carboxyl methyltransferase (ICMT) family protein YpbQ